MSNSESYLTAGCVFINREVCLTAECIIHHMLDCALFRVSHTRSKLEAAQLTHNTSMISAWPGICSR